MVSVTVSLKNIEEIQDFVKRCGKLKCEADVVCGRRMVDAKSILGLCSVDLNRPLKMYVYSEDKDMVYNTIDNYLVS